MKRLIQLTKLLLLFWGLHLQPVALYAQDPTIDTTDNSKSESENAALNYFSNTLLINQFGEEMKFFDDLLKDKIVVINGFYAECVGACPAIHKKFQSIQEHYGDRVGEDIYLISITVDPVNDQPEKLGDFAKQNNAGRGWYFMSGDIENVNFVQKKLGQYVETREFHGTILLAGNVKTGLWKKVNGLASSNDIINVIESVVNDQN